MAVTKEDIKALAGFYIIWLPLVILVTLIVIILAVLRWILAGVVGFIGSIFK